jgi:hypothetical protein
VRQLPEVAAQPTRPAHAPRSLLHLDSPRSNHLLRGVTFSSCLDTGKIGSIPVHNPFKSRTCTRQLLRLSSVSGRRFDVYYDEEGISQNQGVERDSRASLMGCLIGFHRVLATCLARPTRPGRRHRAVAGEAAPPRLWSGVSGACPFVTPCPCCMPSTTIVLHSGEMGGRCATRATRGARRALERRSDGAHATAVCLQCPCGT